MDVTRVAILGASGFIGSNLANHLASSEQYIVSGSFFTNEKNRLSENVTQAQVDCLKLESVKEFLSGHDVAVMCAANTSGAKVIATNPLAHLYQNMIMNTITLQAAYEVGIKKFIFISSNTVYPPGEKRMQEGDENDSYFQAYEVVATMKRNTERMCLLYPSLKTNPMDTRIIRPANSYGPNDKFDPNLSHVIPSLIQKVLASDKMMEVWGDGNDIKDFIYIEDLVIGIEKVIEYNGKERIFNLVSGLDTTIRQILECLKVIVQKPALEFHFDDSKPKMIPIRRLSGNLAAQELGFLAETDIVSGLEKTVKWFVHANRESE